MADPSATDFIISQGDTLPVMEIEVPTNSAGELVDLAGCTVVFHGRPVGTYTTPPPIIRAIESYTVGATSVVAKVKFEATDTATIAMTPGQPYKEMQGELEIVDPATGDVLTIPTDGYITWFIRDDIGDGSV